MKSFEEYINSYVEDTKPFFEAVNAGDDESLENLEQKWKKTNPGLRKNFKSLVKENRSFAEKYRKAFKGTGYYSVDSGGTSFWKFKVPPFEGSSITAIEITVDQDFYIDKFNQRSPVRKLEIKTDGFYFTNSSSLNRLVSYYVNDLEEYEKNLRAFQMFNEIKTYKVSEKFLRFFMAALSFRGVYGKTSVNGYRLELDATESFKKNIEKAFRFLIPVLPIEYSTSSDANSVNPLTSPNTLFMYKLSSSDNTADQETGYSIDNLQTDLSQFKELLGDEEYSEILIAVAATDYGLF